VSAILLYTCSDLHSLMIRMDDDRCDHLCITGICLCRFPTLPVAELQRHQASVNALAWAPHSSCHICTAGDDSQALIWDLSSMSQPMDTSLDPILAYSAGAEVNQLQWSTSQPDWVAICFGSKTQILRV